MVRGLRLPDLGKNYHGREENFHGSRLPDREKRITGHGSRFVWYDLKPVDGAKVTVINLYSRHKKTRRGGLIFSVIGTGYFLGQFSSGFISFRSFGI